MKRSEDLKSFLIRTCIVCQRDIFRVMNCRMYLTSLFRALKASAEYEATRYFEPKKWLYCFLKYSPLHAFEHFLSICLHQSTLATFSAFVKLCGIQREQIFSTVKNSCNILCMLVEIMPKVASIIQLVIHSSDTIRETIEIFLVIVLTTELSSQFVSL